MKNFANLNKKFGVRSVESTLGTPNSKFTPHFLILSLQECSSVEKGNFCTFFVNNINGIGC